jgi:MoxR-like ATPase
LRSGERRDRLATLAATLDSVRVCELQQRVRRIHVAEVLLDYAQRLIARTREHAALKLGLSPRAGQGLIRAAQAWSLLQGRGAVLPEDVQTVFAPIAGHRLVLRDESAARASRDVIQDLLRGVPVPE